MVEQVLAESRDTRHGLSTLIGSHPRDQAVSIERRDYRLGGIVREPAGCYDVVNTRAGASALESENLGWDRCSP